MRCNGKFPCINYECFPRGIGMKSKRHKGCIDMSVAVRDQLLNNAATELPGSKGGS